MKFARKISFKKTSESAIEPTYAGDCSYNIHSLSALKVEPLERVAIRTGISLEFPKPKKLLTGSDLSFRYVVAEIVPDSNFFLDRGLFIMSKKIDGSCEEEEIIINAVNISLPDFLLYKESSALARSEFFGSTNSVTVMRDRPIAKLYFKEESRVIRKDEE